MNSFVLRWADILSAGAEGDLAAYHPHVLRINEPTDENNGTRITLKEINRISDFDAEALANSLSKFFIVVPSFNVAIEHGDMKIELDNERKYSNLDVEFEWSIPRDVNEENEYNLRDNVVGTILTTNKPIPASSKARGITLYSRKKLVNLPEYFSESDSSHFYSYLSGWLEVDFIDDIPDDVIETNRQSLDWAHPSLVELRKYLEWVVKRVKAEWRRKRTEQQQVEISTHTGIDIADWQAKIPEELKASLNPVLDALKGDSDKPEHDLSSIVGIQKLHELVPPYTYFHWRKLHPVLKEVVFDYYVKQDYYTAVMEGVKRYIRSVKDKSGSPLEEKDLIENVFQLNNPVLSVTDGFQRPDGTSFAQNTHKSIKEGHRFLALAIWQAFRNPIAHEEVSDLRNSGLYSEADCLDALSLLSHLFRWLDTSILTVANDAQNNNAQASA